MKEQLHFTIDPYFALNQLCCIYHEENIINEDNVLSEKYSDAFKYTIADLLYHKETMLTEDEWNVIVETYQERNGLSGTFHIDVEPELREGLYQIIQEQQRFKDIELGYILSGYGNPKNIVYDKRSGKVHPSGYSLHYETLIEILKNEYEDEFASMTQEEKDAFIMDNFVLVGKANPQDWYIPDGIGFGSGKKGNFSISYNKKKNQTDE